MTAPAPTDPLTTWTPQAALGLTCPRCHPEHRDGPSPVRPDTRTEPIASGHEEARRPAAPQTTADPAARDRRS
ncbi:MAG TPA: hypothetical protein VFY14_16450 [Streptomyces sp.]|nr:hypothetical protein [Streptomyces sp.]